MLRGERLRVYRNQLLGVYETGTEREMDGAFKIPADANTHVSHVEARERKSHGGEGHSVVERLSRENRRRGERGGMRVKAWVVRLEIA